jgi:tetratricopeptide (TPR) repeat protein
VRAERQANLDAACGFYGQAHTLSPRNPKYFIAYTQMRFKAGNEHVHNGQLLRNTGELERALMEFQQAVEIDPSNFLGGLAQTSRSGVCDLPKGPSCYSQALGGHLTNPSPGPRRLVQAPSRSTLSPPERAVGSVLPCSSSAVSSRSGMHRVPVPPPAPATAGSADLRF